MHNQPISSEIKIEIVILPKSNGYVKDCDVMPANDPAKNLRPLVLQKIHGKHSSQTYMEMKENSNEK